MDDPDLHPRPSLRDWALLLIGVGFVLGGIAILPRNRDVGIVTIALSSMFGAVGLSTIVRKRRDRRLRPLGVEVQGGVPIRPSRGRALWGGIALTAFGGVLVVFGQSYPPVFRLIAGLITAVGGLLVAAVALGWAPVGFLRFDPDGLTLGRRGWDFTVPWDAISEVGTGELHDNAVLLIWLRDSGAVRANPPAARERALKMLASNQRWVGAPISIMVAQYAIDLPVLLAAVRRYVADPRARESLATRPLACGDPRG